MDVRWLLELDAGWRDGAGRPPSGAAVERLREVVSALRFGVERLAIFPTSEGGVLAEAQTDDRRWSLQIKPDGALSIVEGGPDGPPTLTEPQGAAAAARSLERFIGV